MPISAVASSFNEKKICSACEYHDVYESLSTEQWLDRKKLRKILNENKSNSNYDCIIPVSGGKDSYFQAHKIIKEFNLKPLLVTYDVTII